MFKILHAGAIAGALVASTGLALAQRPGDALQQSPPPTALQPAPNSPSLQPLAPSAKIELSDAQKVAILMAIKQDGASITPPPSFSASIGAPVPPSIDLQSLPREALTHAPEANALKYTVVDNEIVLVDPTTMRVVDKIRER